MNLAIFDDRGIRFEYPEGWELDIQEDGPRTTVTAQSPGGLAFGVVAIDDSDDPPTPGELVVEALEALKAEYPTLEAFPVAEPIGDHRATGFDVEFVSLDMSVGCALRGIQTPRRTIFIMTQWSDLEPTEADDALRDLRRSIEETDAD